MMMTVSGENQLQVQMLGGFFLYWNGQPLISSTRTSESQFTYLMQILWHNYRQGVRRGTLEQVLFGDRDIEDIHHATRSVIYNAKKRLKAAGLPQANYIEQNKGVYYWTQEVPVEEDAAEFERLYRAAGEEGHPDQKLKLYLEACQRYTGEFLPAQAGFLWVAQEAKRYRAMFCACVENAVQLLRVSQDFLRMKDLGIHAAKTNPLADWEAVTMEALMSMGQYNEARKLYDDTVELYFQRAGLHPSKRLMELFHKLTSQFESRYSALEEIQEELSEGQNFSQGGYVCPYPVFQGVYRMVRRMMERGGQSVYMMMCTVVDGKENPLREGSALEELSLRLEDAIRRSVRFGDVISRYGKGRYLVLLVNITRENCDSIQKRINSRFVVGRQRTGIQYYVRSVTCSRYDCESVLEEEM